jgi:hypothetical protein
VPLLKEQRTTHKNVQAEYGATIRRTYESFAHLLPETANRIMDIGCGMAGIDVYLSAHYNHEPLLYLVDKHGVADRINSGYSLSADKFAHYHDFDAALDLLSQNGVPLDNVRCFDLMQERFPSIGCDVVISLLSMGFHYPVDDHPWQVREGGVFIADIRKETDNIERLERMGDVQIVHESLKYHRVVLQC